MKTRRTITPVSENEAPVMSRLNFSLAKIAEIGRVDKSAGWVNFQVPLGNGFQTVFEHFGWSVPGEKCSLEKLDGTLKGGNFILASKDKLIDAEVDIEFKEMTGFVVHRMELEGRKKKGFRRELRFKATFECEDGCANLESYMMTTDNARGSLKVMYIREPVQTEMPLNDNQPSLINEEQRDATSAEQD